MCIRLLRPQRYSLNETTLGMDISHWQGRVNFALAKSRGIKFVIHKVCDVGYVSGVPFTDSRFSENYAKIKKEGLLVGGYAWLNPWYDAKKQAEYYLAREREYPLDMPPIVDFEDTKVTDKNDYLYKLQVWLDTVANATGKTPIIYTANWYLNRFDRKRTSWMGAYPLWVASYTSNPYMPQEWDNFLIWQFTEKGHLPRHNSFKAGEGRSWGVSGEGLDLNYFNGSYQDLLNLCNLKTEPIVEPEKPPKELFSIRVTIPVLNIREGAGFNYKRLGYLTKGNEVKVCDVALNGWYKICEDGRWICPNMGKDRYLEHITNTADFKFEAKCLVPVLYKRSANSMNGERIGYLTTGETVQVYEEKDGWYRINPVHEVWCNANPQWIKKVE